MESLCAAQVYKGALLLVSRLYLGSWGTVSPGGAFFRSQISGLQAGICGTRDCAEDLPGTLWWVGALAKLHALEFGRLFLSALATVRVQTPTPSSRQYGASWG